MVSIGFTVCRDEILNGKKETTIRAPRKRGYKDADVLNLFYNLRTKYCYRLFDVPLESVERIYLKDFTEEIALADGFKSLDECIEWFSTTHKKYVESDEYVGFDLISWDFKKRTNVISRTELIRIEGEKVATAFQKCLGVEVKVQPHPKISNEFYLYIPTKNVQFISTLESFTQLLIKI